MKINQTSKTEPIKDPYKFTRIECDKPSGNKVVPNKYPIFNLIWALLAIAASALISCRFDKIEPARAHITMHGTENNPKQIFRDDTSGIWNTLMYESFYPQKKICENRTSFDTIIEVFYPKNASPNGVVLSLEKGDTVIGNFFGRYAECFYVRDKIQAEIISIIRTEAGK